MKKYFHTLIIVLALETNVFSQVWTQEASMSIGRVSSIGCATNGKGYVGMGTITGGLNSSDFWEYDTLANVWTSKADFPADGRNAAVAYAIKGKIYSFFGYDNSGNCRNDVWEYDPASDSWIQKNVFPGGGRYNAKGFVINDSLLFIGTGSYNDGDNYLYDFWMYNPSKDTWLQKADFPGGNRTAAASFSINGIGYFGTGLQNSSTPTNDFWKYNPATDTWTQLPAFPGTSRAACASFVINNEGYIGSGLDNSHFYNDFFKYTPSDSSWTPIVNSPSYNYAGGVGFSMGNKGYSGMGWDTEDFFYDFYQYDPNGNPKGVNDLSNSNIQLYPNPATERVTITLQKQQLTNRTTISIYTMQGQLIKQYLLGQEKAVLDISEIANGIYIVKICNNNENLIITLIKE